MADPLDYLLNKAVPCAINATNTIVVEATNIEQHGKANVQIYLITHSYISVMRNTCTDIRKITQKQTNNTLQPEAISVHNLLIK